MWEHTPASKHLFTLIARFPGCCAPAAQHQLLVHAGGRAAGHLPHFTDWPGGHHPQRGSLRQSHAAHAAGLPAGTGRYSESGNEGGVCGCGVPAGTGRYSESGSGGGGGVYLQAQDVILNQVMRGVCVGVVYLQAQDVILNQVMRGGCGVYCSFAFDSPMCS